MNTVPLEQVKDGNCAGLVGGKMSIMKQASTFGVATRDYERTAFFAHEVLIQFMLLDSLALTILSPAFVACSACEHGKRSLKGKR